MTVAIIGYGRFGRALGSLLEAAGIGYRAWDTAADIPEPAGDGVNFDVDDTESAPGRPQLVIKSDIGVGHLQIDRLGDDCA